MNAYDGQAHGKLDKIISMLEDLTRKVDRLEEEAGTKPAPRYHNVMPRGVKARNPWDYQF